MHRSSVIFPYVRSFALVYFLASALLAVLLTLLEAAGNVSAWVPALLAGAYGRGLPCWRSLSRR